MAGAGGSRSGGARRGAKEPRAQEPPAEPPALPPGCGSCGSPSLTRLPMVLADGTDVVFVSCHACERRAWLRADGDGGFTPIPIDSVLERSARRR